MATEHNFDRRNTDVNVNALTFRVAALETRMEIMEGDMQSNARELRANTALTSQVHEAMFGRDAPDGEHEPGVTAKVKEMHALFTDGQRGLRMLNGIAEFGAKAAKPIAAIGLVVVAGVAYVKTGVWKWPPL